MPKENGRCLKSHLLTKISLFGKSQEEEEALVKKQDFQRGAEAAQHLGGGGSWGWTIQAQTRRGATRASAASPSGEPDPGRPPGPEHKPA